MDHLRALMGDLALFSSASNESSSGFEEVLKRKWKRMSQIGDRNFQKYRKFIVRMLKMRIAKFKENKLSKNKNKQFQVSNKTNP